MAKQGFATSDRRKVEIVPGDKAVQVHDCGTVFVTTAVGAVVQAFTLPAISQAGAGWWWHRRACSSVGVAIEQGRV